MTDFLALLRQVSWPLFAMWVVWVVFGLFLLLYTSTVVSPQAVSLQIQRLGYTYDAASLFQAVRAQDVKAVQAFLAAGMSANLQNSDGHLLAQASRTGNLQIVQSLLEHEADVNLAGRASLSDAVSIGSERVLRTLLERFTPTKSDAFYFLWTAAKRGDAKIIALLLKVGADADQLAPGAELVLNGMTPLMVAAGDGHLEAVKVLVEAGADVNRDRAFAGDTQPRNETACHWAVRGIDPRTSPEQVEAGRRVCEYLKQHGATNCVC